MYVVLLPRLRLNCRLHMLNQYTLMPPNLALMRRARAA